MDLEEKQAEMASVVKDARSLLDDLVCAESCENEKDFKVNVEDAIDQASSVLKALRSLLKGEVPS